jgi:hypothetical protein
VGEWENGIVTDPRVLAVRQCQRVIETERGGGPRELAENLGSALVTADARVIGFLCCDARSQ